MVKRNISEINLSLRDLIIIALIMVCLYLILNPFGDSNIQYLKQKNKELDNQISKIDSERDSLKKERITIIKKIDSLSNMTSIRQDSIKKLKEVAYRQKEEIKDQNQKIKVFDDMLRENEKQIEDLKRNPLKLPKNKLVEKISEKL